MRKLGSIIILAGAVVAVAPPTGARAAYIDSNLPVTPAAHANGGGCYPVSIAPGLLDMLTLIDPEWAPVDPGAHLPPLSDPQTVHGTVAFAKVNESGDFPSSHITDDQNTFITVDAADMGLVATGNVSAEGVEDGTMEVEREIGLYPLFAWAGEGNRMTAVGRWIWDCGHPLQDPAGTCSATTTQSCIIDADCASPVCPGCLGGETCQNVNFNYHSEIHPPQAIAVSRLNQGYRFSKNMRSGRLATRTDVWISPNGGGAGDQCQTTHQPSSLGLLSLQCLPFSQPMANVNASDFAFDVPLPPRPAGNTDAGPRVRVIDRTPKGLPKPAVTTSFVDGANPVVHAVVHMTAPVAGTLPSDAGKTIIAGWRRDPTPITHVQVRITGLEVLNALKAATPAVALKKRCSVTTAQDCSVNACPSGEQCLTLGGPTPGWQIWAEVNGDWRQLQHLDAIASPTAVPLNEMFDVGLPASGVLDIHLTGKSVACLESQLYDQSLGRSLALYGLTDGALCLNDQSKDIGHFDVTFTAPDFGSGGQSMSHATQSTGGDGGHCSATTATLCVGNADCPVGETCVATGGSYTLHYTVTKR
jgi:hypothetical protein